MTHLKPGFKLKNRIWETCIKLAVEKKKSKTWIGKAILFLTKKNGSKIVILVVQIF